MSENQVLKTRIKWIDCAKAIAIMAVVVDHCNGVLYTNQAIACASYFSVSLFVLLSGLSAQITSRGGVKPLSYQLKKVGSFFLEYMLATFVLYCFYFRGFDLKTYIAHVLNFSISGQYYFFVFFFQLLLTSPFLVSWCKFCESKKYSILLHILTIVSLGYISYLMISYTFILSVHGGGKYMFGGTYLLIYYIGILLGNFKIFECTKKGFIFVVSLAAWLGWWYMSYNSMLPFDRWMQVYWGDGFNPPSINFIVFAIITCFLCFSGFSILENLGSVGKGFVNIMSILGKNTLYTFMYHLLVKDILVRYIPSIVTCNIMLRLLCFIIIVILPVIVVLGIKRVKQLYQNKIKELETSEIDD